MESYICGLANIGMLDLGRNSLLIKSKEPLSKTGLNGLQAAGRLQGPEVGPELPGAAGIRGVSGGPRPCVGRTRP